MLVKLGGAERVVQTLAELFPDAPIYTLMYDQEKVGRVFPAKRVICSHAQKKYQQLKKPQLILPYLRHAIESFDFSGFDLVISSSSGFAHGILLPLDTKHICYCHSPMRYAWDYTQEYRKDKSRSWFKKPLSLLISKMLHSIRIWDFVCADRPDYYIAASHHVQKRIQKYYKQEAPVIYPPVNIDRFNLTPKHDNFFLIVAALTAWKKIDLAIRAFNDLGKTLIIIGDGQEMAQLTKIAGPNIHFLGRQTDEVVTEYMQNCRAFIFPSEDDFGITPIEVMACGKPVIAFKKGGAVETIQADTTGVFFDEQNVESLKKAVSKYLNIDGDQGFNPQFIRHHAEQFDQTRFIREMKDFVSKAMT